MKFCAPIALEFGCAQKHLVNQNLLDTFKSMVHSSRNLPLSSFSFLWNAHMEWLLQQNEKALVAALKRTYFYHVQRVGVPLIEADFRQGLDRLLPATHSGSQSQEIWQRHRLRATMPDLKLPAAMCVEKIGALLKSRFAQMKLMAEPLWHVPCRRWSKDLISEAQELLSLDGQSLCANLEGSHYTLLRKDVSDPGKLRTDGLMGTNNWEFCL